uniref:Retrotrans_gag domain-containing protein n=1 Tax=Strongyloides papillosus TaxID=174720 RepID=A0A0N5CB67_STREA
MSRLFKRLQKRSLKQEQIDEKAFKAAYGESCGQWIAEQREHVNDSKESQENVILSQQAELTILLDPYNTSVNARDQFVPPRYKGQMKKDENFSVTEKELHNMFWDALKHFIQRFNGNSLAALRRYEAHVKSHLTEIAQSPDRLAILDRIAAGYAPTLMNTSEIGRQYLSHALTRIEHPATLTRIFQQMIDDGLLQAERLAAVKPVQRKQSVLEYKTEFDRYIEKVDGYSAITSDITTNIPLKTRIFNDFVSGLRYNLRMLTDVNDFDKLSYSELVAKFVATENRIGIRTFQHMHTDESNQQPRFPDGTAVFDRRGFRKPVPNTFRNRSKTSTPVRSLQSSPDPSNSHEQPNNFPRTEYHRQTHTFQPNNFNNNDIMNYSPFSSNQNTE